MLKNLAAISITSTSAIYLKNSYRRKQKNILEAWQVFDDVYFSGKTRSYALKVSIEYLASESISLEKIKFNSQSGKRVMLDLSGISLREANLQEADLSYVNLSGANLKGADLKGANLEGANLQKSDLEGAFLTGAILKGCDLSKAKLENTTFFFRRKQEEKTTKRFDFKKHRFIQNRFCE